MQLTTLVTIGCLLAHARAFTPPAHCETITTSTLTDPYLCTAVPTYTCVRPACITVSKATRYCNCAEEILTVAACQTECPTGCDVSYTTTTESCSQTYPTETSSFPTYTPPIYGNTTTKTTTSTDIITVTDCPDYTTCSGQTVTYTSTEVCPTSTCTCVLPGGPPPLPPVTTTSYVPPETATPPPVEPVTSVTSTEVVPPPDTTSPGGAGEIETESPSASPTFEESNEAGRMGVKVGVAGVGGLLIAALGVL